MFAISLLHKHLQQGIYERNQLLAHDIAKEAEQFLGELEFDLKTAAELLGPGRIVPAESVDAYLETLVRSSERMESVFLLDADRQVKNLGLNDRLAMHRDDYRGVDFSHHTLFRQYPLIERPVWSDTFISLASGEPSVTLAIPLAGQVLIGNFTLKSLSRQLATVAIDSSDRCAIVDHVGTLVASSDPALAMQRINFGDHPAIKRALHGKGETVQDHKRDRLVLESTAPIPRTGWVAWVGADLGARMAPVEHIRNLLIGIMLLAMLLAAGVALVDARRLMQPLSVLNVRAEQIGAGQYDVEFHPSGFVEIDGLASGLREMSQAVHDRELSLVASERRFRNLVNSIDGVVWEMDVSSGDYLFVSERSFAMFGYPPEDWLGNRDFWAQHVHPEDLDRVVIRGHRSLALNEKHDLEYRFIAADGEPLWVRDLVTVVWEGDEPTRLLGVIIDITERKRNEAELENYRRGLESLVAMKTRELQAAQNELVQKERLAVLGQLTATVSHEIRNPLGTVANTLYLLHELLDADSLVKVERPLALAERSVQRCDGIISELLDFTRRRELQRETVAIDRWLGELLDELAWPEQVSCIRHFACNMTVRADPERLRRALVNVITNALQAMEEKTGAQRLEVLTRCLTDRCEIVVKDSGVGIPADLMPRIYEPLFSTKNFGVGLGVPIIRNIMADHGGGVDYQSVAGEGTTVTFWLPLRTAENEA